MKRETRFFIKMNLGPATEELIKDPNAWALYCQIAIRARWKAGYETRGGVQVFLQRGQSLLGDYENVGLTEKKYRKAKERLSKCKLASFKGANRGTVATLLNNSVFDIPQIKGADKGRTEGD